MFNIHLCRQLWNVRSAGSQCITRASVNMKEPAEFLTSLVSIVRFSVSPRSCGVHCRAFSWGSHPLHASHSTYSNGKKTSSGVVHEEQDAELVGSDVVMSLPTTSDRPVLGFLEAGPRPMGLQPMGIWLQQQANHLPHQHIPPKAQGPNAMT